MIYDYLVKWTKNTGEVINLDHVIDIRCTLNKDAKSNSAEVIVPRRPYTFEGDVIFKSGESLIIYAKNDGLINRTNPSDNDLLFTASVLDTERQISAGFIKLVCGDLTYNLLSTLFNQDVIDTPDDIVNLIVQNAGANGTEQVTIPTNIQSAKSDTSAFANTNFVSAWKTSYDCINELSGTAYTGDDKVYLFWFDADGTFNWIYPESTLETLEIVYGDGIKDIKHTRDNVETVSMLI